MAYNNGTGAITYTGPSASEVRSHFSAGTNISITDGEITTSSNIVANLTGNVTGNVSGTVSSLSNHSTLSLQEVLQEITSILPYLEQEAAYL